MFADTIEVLTYPTVLDYGRPVPDFTQNPAAVPVAGVDAQPGASSELIAQRAAGSAVRWSVFVPHRVLPAGVTLSESSIVRFRGRRYEVDGDPLEWGDGSGPLDHLVVALVSWEPPA
jgi:hypothetical protein